ncbi:hypothetical protein [Pelosinus sp. UFO1]|uniref:hypothetical protein n=1 Tax=Pelosinus sp. UFO1 TaxID=484770 RepID=UPI0004D1440E|nr:hypothetical protein [Pelosinus sp. UFO1]AIF52589.1 hypothetical protein UFO1_3046 [Pelosinus sp. UFO1]
MNRLRVTSTSTKKNTIIMMVGITFFAVLLTLNIIKLVTMNIFQPLEFAFDALFLVVLFNRINAKYTCEMYDKCLVFNKSSLWGKKRYDIFYPSIIGIYKYQPKLVEITKFRRTYRLHSALDASDVWTIAYTVTTINGKKENCRIYFKPGDLFLGELHRVLPGKVMINEERVILADIAGSK